MEEKPRNSAMALHNPKLVIKSFYLLNFIKEVVCDLMIEIHD